MNRIRISNRIVFGIIVIFIGVILLLNSMNLIDADISFSTYWPLILIAFGIAKIISFDESTFTGGILLIIGLYFQLKNLDIKFIQDIRISSVFWPVVVILFGLSLIFENRGKKNNVTNTNESTDDTYR